MKEYWTSSSNNRLDLKYKADYKMKFDDFYQVVLDKQTSLSGLINKDGEIVLPLEFGTIKYAWKGHPIIASTEAGYNAYDSNGKKLLDEDFVFIEHTKDPTIIIVGKKDENYNDFSALVDLTEPENIDYKYEELSNLGGNYLMVRDGDSTESYIINYQGIALGNFKYKSITMPDYREFERFMRTPGTNGNLIAVGQVDRKYFAINDKGETFELVD